MRVAAIAILLGCSAPPHKPPASALPPPPAIAGGRVDIGSWGIAYLQSFTFVDGGRRLIAGNAGALAEIDPATRKLVATASLASGMIPNPQGRPGVGEMLAWNVDAAIWAWDPAAASIVGVISLSAQGNAPTGLAVWAPATGAPALVPVPDGETLCQPLAWSPDRARFVARVAPAPHALCDADAQAIQVFAAAGGAPETRVIDAGFANVAAFSADGRYVAAGGDADIRVYDLHAHAVADRIRARGVRSIAFHPTTPLVAWADSSGTVRVWRLDGPEPPPANPPRPRGKRAEPHGPPEERRAPLQEIGKGRGVAFSPDGRYLAIASELAVTVLDGATFERIGEPLRDLHGVAASIDVAFSDDSRTLAVALSGTDIGVWRIGGAPPASGESTWFAQLRPLPIPEPRPPPPITRDGEIEIAVTSHNKPIANAEVTLRPHWQEYADARALAPIVLRTGPDGAARVANAPTIEWVATVDAPGLVLGGSILDLRESKTQRAAYDLDPAVTIAGTVAPADKRPIRITHYRYDGELELDIAAKPDGSFVIDHVRPGGTYELVARRADGAVKSAVVDLTSSGRQKLALALLRADDPHVVRVAVVDGAGAPIANATVVVDELHSVPTDAQGRASLDVADAKHVVRAMTKTGGSDAFSVDLPQAKPLTIAIPAK